MSSIEMKNFTNMFCRLIGSLRDSEFICHEFLADAMQIKSSFHKMSLLGNATDPDLLIDDDEVERIKKENEEMKMLLADYHRGVELLMTAYRERVLKNMLREKEEAKTESSKPELFDAKLFETIIDQSEKIFQMHNVMRRASNADTEAEHLVAQQMSFLRKENDILKELYEASRKFGTSGNRLRFNELSLKEAEVQTDFVQEEHNNLEIESKIIEQNQSQCSDEPWEHFEAWQQSQKVDLYSNVESEEDEDEITVVDFETHVKSGAHQTDKKNFSSQAYTF